MSILRGLATTQYGSLGRNGVILASTKTGGGASVPKYTASLASHMVKLLHIPE
jgi:hypothetical protein